MRKKFVTSVKSLSKVQINIFKKFISKLDCGGMPYFAQM